ncbi:VOC family protein [Streptococcus respiraculi]|uniref:VOC family protein n=1 Tax=Streptococcus respiraculi TaxID=2021971 RepID=UPI000E71B492|nr:VOC family protein [Streptococcus respiraculi]
MVYPYNSQIFLGEVALYVKNLENVTRFYQQMLGLAILDKSDTDVLLGVGDEGLVRLLPASHGKTKTHGLYHLALLVPTRQDLATIFKRLAENRIPMVGGADHGYSEAIYLEDTEGNGIEIYHDKDVSAWDIREDGRIVGITEELAAQDLYDKGAYAEPFRLAVGTRMGHVHLSVKDSQFASAFYQNLLGLNDTFSISNASWLASGDYHHHLAVNEWDSKLAASRETGQAGLAYFTVCVKTKTDLVAIHERARSLGMTPNWIHSRLLEVVDGDGIVVRVGLR